MKRKTFNICKILFILFILTLSVNSVQASTTATKKVTSTVETTTRTFANDIIGYANCYFNEPVQNYNNSSYFHPASYTGNPPTFSIGTNGYRGFNYMKLQSNGYGDSFAEITTPEHDPYFWCDGTYYLSAYVKIPVSGTRSNNPLITVTNRFDNVILGTANPPSGPIAATDWVKVTCAFSIPSQGLWAGWGFIWDYVNIRINVGNLQELDVTGVQFSNVNPLIPGTSELNYDYATFKKYFGDTIPTQDTCTYNEPFNWLTGYDYESTSTLTARSVTMKPEPSSIVTVPPKTNYVSKSFNPTQTGTFSNNSNGNFPSQVLINQEGYSGYAPLASVDWTPNYASNRSVTLNSSYTDGQYYENSSEFNYISSVNQNYYDSVTGQTLTYNLPVTSSPYQIGTTSSRTIFSDSKGYNRTWNKEGVDNHEFLGYMSNNPYSYWGGAYSYNSASARRPTDYYGPKKDKQGWQLITCEWLADENHVNSANDYLFLTPYFGSPYFSHMWVTDSGSGRLPNLYRKGVHLRYQKNVPISQYQVNYGATVKLPSPVVSWTGVAHYDTTLQKVASTTEGYSYATSWQVTVNYEGEIKAYPHAPIAQFTVTNPQLDNQLLIYNDTSYETDSWNRITQRLWSYSQDNGVTWSAEASNPPYNLTNLNNQASTPYKVRLRVCNGANPPYTGLWSNYCIKDVVIYPYNTKPSAVVKIDPIIVKPNDPITITDNSTANDSWDSIDQKVWSYRNVNSSTWTNGIPNSFDSIGTYEIRLKVHDKGNILSPGMWSDDCIPKVYVNNNTSLPNIHLDSISVVGEDNESPSITLYKGINYRIKAVIKNDTEADILTPFDTSFNLGTLVADGKQTCNSLLAGETKTLYIPFQCTEQDTTNTLEVFTDNTNNVLEVNEEDNALTMQIQTKYLPALLMNFRLQSMINPPKPYIFPLYINSLPAECKSGYQNTFLVDTFGLFDRVQITSSINGLLEDNFNLTKITEDISTKKQTWQLQYIVPLDTERNSIINFKVKGYINSNSTIFDYNSNNSWLGDVLTITGSALDDVFIRRRY
jgi:hypothetical protein